MVVFPNCKINLGLRILNRREDGYHNLQSIFIPIQLCDALEIIEADADEMFIHGKKIEGESKNNSCFKALQILRSVRIFPYVQIHLLKHIPIGAGLGGGSSDGAFTLKLLNDKFNLGFSDAELAEFAIKIGSDCVFFIHNQPAFIEGKGEIISPIRFSLKGYLIAIAFPEIHIDTTIAYNLLSKSRINNTTIVNDFKGDNKENFQSSKPEDWKHIYTNDFENVIFSLYPEIREWKENFLNQGAILSLMSGSGSSVFAIMKNDSDLTKLKKTGKYSRVFFQDM